MSPCFQVLTTTTRRSRPRCCLSSTRLVSSRLASRQRRVSSSSPLYTTPRSRPRSRYLTPNVIASDSLTLGKLNGTQRLALAFYAPLCFTFVACGASPPRMPKHFRSSPARKPHIVRFRRTLRYTHPTMRPFVPLCRLSPVVRSVQKCKKNQPQFVRPNLQLRSCPSSPLLYICARCRVLALGQSEIGILKRTVVSMRPHPLCCLSPFVPLENVIPRARCWVRAKHDARHTPSLPQSHPFVQTAVHLFEPTNPLSFRGVVGEEGGVSWTSSFFFACAGVLMSLPPFLSRTSSRFDVSHGLCCW